MIDWPTIKTTAQGIFADLTGADVRWTDESKGSAWAPDGVIYLRITSLRQVGTPEEFRDDNPDGDQTVTVGAQKVFTLQLRVETFDQDVADAGATGHAGALLETLKTRLKRSSTIERLRGVFAIQEILGSNWFNYVNQGRQISVYTLDLLCATADNDVDATDQAGDYIDEVQVESINLTADGQPVTNQVNLDIRGS